MKLLNKMLIGIFLLTFLLTTGSWGFLVHRTVHQLAVYQLPPQLRSFFYDNIDTLVKHSVRPDQRRSSDSTEASKHFIDLEVYKITDRHNMPLQWTEAETMFTRDTLLKYGYVPYHILYMKEKLTDAFRHGNTDSILFYAADLGHYIADANVPLHTSVNYDGQLTNQKGLHSLWESMVPELEIAGYKLKSKHKATYLSNPADAIMKAVVHAHSLLPAVFEKETLLSKSFPDSLKYRIQYRRGRESRSYTSAFAKAYAKELAPTINDQLLTSANTIADFWYTSWVDAGRPAIQGFKLNEEKKERLREELNAYKSNSLLEKNLLRSKKRAEEKTEEQ